MPPLAGIRIIEFDGLGPVTFAGMMLADMGAEVVRLTRADGGGAFAAAGGPLLHRGRPAVAVDLKSPGDVARVLDLTTMADAVIEGFRPGVLERLGLGPDILMARSPALVVGRVTGWGQNGPLAQAVGHDLNYLGLTGLLHAMGHPDHPPPPPLNLVADYGGGALMLVSGMLAALLSAQRTGRGQVVDAAMTDGAALMGGLFQALRLQGLWSDQRQANLLDGSAPFYRCYACKDGRFVAVAALEPRFYAALLAGLSVTEEDAPQHNRSRWPQTQARFEALFAARDRDAWVAHFESTEACVTPVLDLTEAPRHPHNRARNVHDADGLPRPAPRFSACDGAKPSSSAPISLDSAIKRWESAR